MGQPCTIDSSLGTSSDTIASNDALALQLVQNIALPSVALDSPLVTALTAPLSAPLGPQAASLPPAALLALHPSSTTHACYCSILHTLHATLCPSTCFTLLGAAYHLDAPCLFHAAHAACVAHFTTAQQLDVQGLASLPLPVLKLLLRDEGLQVRDRKKPLIFASSNHQQVDNEVQVFRASASWVAAHPAHRLSILRPLLGAAVDFFMQ